MKGFSAYLQWVAGLAGLLLVGTAGCAEQTFLCDLCRVTNECWIATCDISLGECLGEEPRTAGTPCDSGNGTCLDGECLPNPCAGVECDDDNECTEDVCNSDGECEHPALVDTECNAGSGVCVNSVCVDSVVEGCGSVSQAFADGNFADGDWTFMKVEGRSEGNNNIDSVTTVSTGGNPDAYHRVEVTVTATTAQASGIWVAHAFMGAEYDPSTEGEICGLRVFLDGTDQFDEPQRSSFFSVFLLQDGTYYRGEPTLEVESGMWETKTWTTDDFARFDGDGPLMPDLSASGTTIQFGYMTGSSRPTTAPGSGTTIAGADNFRVEIFPPAP